MTQEARLGRPMVRGRIAGPCQEAIAGPRDSGVRSAANDEATDDRVAGIVEERASSLLRSLT